MADHVAVASRRREDVEARGARWRCRRATGALCATSGRKRGRGRGKSSRSSSFRRLASTDSGSIACCENEAIESHVVDPASIATSRRRRRAKTDRIDGEALVRALLAYKRGEPRVCAMVKAPTPKEEDRRRLCRERKVLIAERVRHVNRVKGLLFSAGDIWLRAAAPRSAGAAGYAPDRRWSPAAGSPEGAGSP